jgi:hypothetical protein
MNGHEPDTFEKRLQQQTLRPVPPSWREGILAAARTVAPSPRPCAQQQAPGPDGLSLLTAWLRSLLWPNPRVWAGFAVVWVALLAENVATREPSRQEVAARPASASPQIRELLLRQEQLLAELVGPLGKPDADPPKPVGLQPRSQRQEDFMNG